MATTTTTTTITTPAGWDAIEADDRPAPTTSTTTDGASSPCGECGEVAGYSLGYCRSCGGYSHAARLSEPHRVQMVAIA